MKTSEEIKAKIEDIKNLEVSVRRGDSFQLYAIKLLEWVLK